MERVFGVTSIPRHPAARPPWLIAGFPSFPAAQRTIDVIVDS